MKKILILLSGPFLKRDYERFGIDTLKKNFLVKAIDCTSWTHPELWKEYSKIVFKCKEHVVISCKRDFLTLLSQINPVIVIDSLHSDKKTNWMRQQIKKNKKNLFVVLRLNLIPYPSSNIIEISRKLFNLVLKPKECISRIVKVLEQKYYNLRKPIPDTNIVGCLVGKKKSKAKNNVNAHCMDYDIYLSIKNKPVSNNNSYAVFLDEGMSYHSDYFIFNSKPPVSEEEYYPLLVKFLNKFEMETKLSVLFAIHPKTPNHIIEKFPNLLQGIKYQIGNTAELVRDSNVVLLHQSTSFSFAVLFNKPAIFLTSNKLRNSWIGPRIDNLAKILNGKVINMNNDLNKPLDLQNLLKIDENKYKNYLDQYLKVPNSPDIPLWEIFTDFIKKNHSKSIIK